MRVLVACEESQTVTLAFRSLGHSAFSCDIQPCSGGHPEWHYKADALSVLDLGWDLIIAHPPCTYLSNAGACRMFRHGEINNARFQKAMAAREFFMAFYDYPGCSHICIENPVPLSVVSLPPYSQIIEPCYFGDPWLKRTCLWLRGLPGLFATDMVVPVGKWVYSDKDWGVKGQRTQKMRSKTFPGVASAMAVQFTNFLERGCYL